jgi:diguanylate cyclase (GGDEF)-like protein
MTGKDPPQDPIEGRRSERDEAADRRDLAADDRDHTGDRRDDIGDERDRAADRRDEMADTRDRTGEARDRAADERDMRAEDSESAGTVTPATAADSSHLSALARRHAAADRAEASHDRHAGARERALADEDRETARTDRVDGAGERGEAGHDRRTASVDRGVSASDRDSASMDGLTGVFTRAAGFLELGRDIARTQREGVSLTLAFVDVDQLKAVNDSLGHAAGDRLLVNVASSLRNAMRSYDLIMRYGGDEFVCALSGLHGPDVNQRLMSANSRLSEEVGHGSFTVGVAELRPGEEPDALIARADDELYRARRDQRAAPRATTGGGINPTGGGLRH